MPEKPKDPRFEEMVEVTAWFAALTHARYKDKPEAVATAEQALGKLGVTVQFSHDVHTRGHGG